MPSSPPETAYTIIGTPFSTFTRTVTLGLHHKGVRFAQAATPAHTTLAERGHPWGFVPSLVIHRGETSGVHAEIAQGDGDVVLCESQAIARYLDRVHPAPSLVLAEGEADVPERMWEFVSLVASFAFPCVEIPVIKPWVTAHDADTLSAPSVQSQLSAGLSELALFLQRTEARMVPAGRGPFAFGPQVTWADFYLFPPLDDVRTVPEGRALLEGRQRLGVWLEAMDKLEEVRKTREGTLAAGGRP